MKLHSFKITDYKVDGGPMFGVVPKAIWSRRYPADDKNLCNCSIRALVIIDGDRKVLVDTGYGDKQDERFFKHLHLSGGKGLIGGLDDCNLKPEDITDVILTHLHSDHCGGAIKNGENGYKTVFKNAKYWVSREQWEWAINPNKREADAYLSENLLPLRDSGQLSFISDKGEITPNIKVKLFNGHTMGQVIPYVNYNGRTVVFVADLIPTSANVPLKYNAAYDVFPMEQLKEKESFLNSAVENNYIIFFQHDYSVECCTLANTDRGIVIKDTFTVSEIEKMIPTQV
jgi:glyoxylase-like metal-dependent hydrolase (beta-lactamase superfamily II)